MYFSVPPAHFVPIGVCTQPGPEPVMLPPFSLTDAVYVPLPDTLVRQIETYWQQNLRY